MRHLLVVVLFFVSLANAVAQQPARPENEPDVNALSKASQNPISDLVSVPFQFNLNSGGGLQDRTFLLLNIQPVIPFKLTDDWNVVVRTVVPVVSIPGPFGTHFSGIADIQEQIYFSPSKPSKFIWGAGPVFSLPVATTIAAETGSWAAGPTAVALVITGPWVVGAVANNVWTFSDTGGPPEVNQFFLQYFINYNFGKGWAIQSAPSNTANWDAASGERWTVPLGLGIGRTIVFDERPMVLGFQYYHNVKRPSNAASNDVRFQVTLLYPEKKK